MRPARFSKPMQDRNLRDIRGMDHGRFGPDQVCAATAGCVEGFFPQRWRPLVIRCSRQSLGARDGTRSGPGRAAAQSKICVALRRAHATASRTKATRIRSALPISTDWMCAAFSSTLRRLARRNAAVIFALDTRAARSGSGAIASSSRVSAASRSAKASSAAGRIPSTPRVAAVRDGSGPRSGSGGYGPPA